MATAAAAESAKKLERLLECPICMKTITQPKVFHCLHFFCAPCVGDLKPKTVDSEPSYACPTCRQVTPIDKLRHMHFIHDLLEIMALAKLGQKLCDKCKEEVATHRCLDCKEHFCEACRGHHLGFSFLEHHTWQELSESDQPMLDKHIHCESHKGEIVKFHCKDCHKLICLLCNGTEHKSHHAETIEEAIKHLLPLVKKRTEEVKTLISAKEKALSGVQRKAGAIRKQYNDIETEIEAKCEAVIAKARADCNTAKQDLAKRKQQHITHIEEFEKKLEDQIKGQTNIVALSETALASTQGTSLLQAMQAGILESLETHLKHEDIPDVNENVKVQFKPAIESRENSVGVITDKDTKFKQGQGQAVSEPKANGTGTVAGAGVKPVFSKMITQRLCDTIERNTTLQRTIETGYSCRRLTKIGNEIWFISWNSCTCNVYSMDGTKLRNITFPNIGNCRSLVQVNSGLAVASSQGLYLSDMNGAITHNLLNGHIVDVSLCGETLCALNSDGGTIQVLKLDQRGTTIKDKTTFKTQSYNRALNFSNTIQMTPQFIYVAVSINHVIFKYAHDGTFLAQHGSRGVAADQLWYPRLCGADPDGTLLINDENNLRIKTLTSDGTWKIFNINGLQYPMDALIDDDKLYVGQRNGDLKQYSIK